MKFFCLFAAVFSILGASCKSQSGVTGTFIGLTNDTLWIRVSVLNEEYQLERKRMDTVVVRNGKFFYNPQTNNLTELQILPLSNIERMPGGMLGIPPGSTIVLLYFPGNHIRLDAVFEDKIVDFQARGNIYNEQLSTLHTNTLGAYKQRNDALKVISDGSFTGDKTVYQGQLREAVGIINNHELNYICENPDEPFSAYLVASWNYQFFDRILQYADSLGVEAKNSEMGRILWKKIDDFHAIRDKDGEKKEKDIARKEMIGKPAPEITLKDINENEFSLSSLRGKYVVLDFWGSWCGWCLAAFPDLKKYYTDYLDEFEIVGIAFSDKPEDWRKAVSKYALPWINIFDDNDLHDKYYIYYAPTYVLIDKEGVIVDFPSFHPDVIKQLNELREKRLL